MVMIEEDTLSDFVLEPKKYSPFPLDSYDKGRHIPLNDARELIISQKDSNLNVASLDKAIENKNLTVYSFGREEKYLDRLDIGRVFHTKKDKKGLTIEKYFSKNVDDVFESFGKYKPRNLKIERDDGEIIFEMKNAMFPESWTDQHAKIVAQKYCFRPNKPEWKEKLKNKLGIEEENSPKHLITRVSNFFADEGWKLGYFATEDDRENFRSDLMFLQAHRMAAFNSPVYFNVGLFSEYGVEGAPAISFTRNPKTGEVKKVTSGCYVNPVTHACFIRAARDNLVSILQQGVEEGSIFGHGSGVGGNIGALREKGSSLSGGGKPSGPLSFMAWFDRGAATIKSGGKSRRAARMQTMNSNHPDIEDFIMAKIREDKKALILMENGYSPGMDGEAYTTVAFQNSNLSVRLDDKFFEALKNTKNGKIDLISVNTGDIVGQASADDLLKRISFGSWRIGDPGVQYSSMIQEYNTCPLSGTINSSNPCGEYIFLDDTSCDLASTNILTFTDLKGNFDTKSFTKANRIMTIALDIANNVAAYPVEEIARVSPEFATIGLGYTNLGNTLIRKGLAYDSEEGRAFTSAITAIMGANANETSAELAEHLGTFMHFELNKKQMLKVIRKHKKNLETISWEHVDENLKKYAFKCWSRTEKAGGKFGFRNAQTTVIAPTGTISYLMGCDTTGIEGAYELITTKFLAGGGEIDLINREVPNALDNLGYNPEQKEKIQKYLTENKTLVDCPDLIPEHRNIFATAKGDANGQGAIPFKSHIKMVAAAQPFVSGGISKTMNLPGQANVRQIYDGFVLGYKLGVKGLTIFRDDSKPISVMGDQKTFVKLKRGQKRKLEDIAKSRDFKIQILDPSTNHLTKLHVLVTEFPNGKPGQIGFFAYEPGSSLGALLRQSGISATTLLKGGLDLEDALRGWIGPEYSPKGRVWANPHVKDCKSVLDAAAKIILLQYKGMKEFAVEPDKVDITTLRGFENGAFRAYNREKIDDWSFDDVMEDHEWGGFVESKGDLFTLQEEKIERKDLLVCRSCGQKTLRRVSSNCYECPCGNKIGGCSA